MARNGHGPMSDLSSLSGEERKSNFGAVRSVDDPDQTSACILRVAVVRPVSALSHGVHLGDRYRALATAAA